LSHPTVHSGLHCKKLPSLVVSQTEGCEIHQP
jgi:hypothetical protein